MRLTGPPYGEAARVLDEYRQHYGANPAPEAVEAWLREQVGSGRMKVWVTGDAICTVAVVPAALTLRTVWLIRDLYVRPAARRQGMARALLAAVEQEARAAGAHRLSLQTETANVRAIDLYAASGFAALTEVTVMDDVLG
ncbi:GNAT family N-acetyltransferase [Paractinoplanes atraurantiacus]|uniref:Acetyltransferase (GNAT) family protein n=1 Tax=Paractinoplanes atraurantiacus TaxID=1036182 RepID=A0A285I2N9_9ACTN|nr:GNAT family N-acetyltransferase [Actinoplanes atraurantiacus]SNY42163.1 Acetyltransferase (GNAT) family protein [Actinoplanes atraurantiacus]